MAADWTREEVELIVAAYFEMLKKEQAAIAYNKPEVRRRLLPLLNNRSEGSGEFNNRNMLARWNQPVILGEPVPKTILFLLGTT